MLPSAAAQTAREKQHRKKLRRKGRITSCFRQRQHKPHEKAAQKKAEAKRQNYKLLPSAAAQAAREKPHRKKCRRKQMMIDKKRSTKNFCGRHEHTEKAWQESKRNPQQPGARCLREVSLQGAAAQAAREKPHRKKLRRKGNITSCFRQRQHKPYEKNRTRKS